MFRYFKQRYSGILNTGIILIVLSYITFISLGLPDGLLGVAWPSMRQYFSRSLDSLGILLIALTTGYLISSFFSGAIYLRFGLGKLLAVSCGATGASLLGYTIMPDWWMIIPLAVIAGLGAGAIDAGMNSYVAANHGERLMQWLHASYGIGITFGPIIMTAGINWFNSWKVGYIIVGLGQIILAACFGLTHDIWNKEIKNEAAINAAVRPKVSVKETLSNLKVWESLLLFFAYAGIEATLGIWSYSLLIESRNIPSGVAGIVVGSYWASFTIGRVIAGFITKRIPLQSLIKLCLLLSLFGALLLLWNPFKLSSLIAVVIIGFAIAPIFPGMVSLTMNRVGERYMANTVGMQISAAGLGVAVIPAITGIIAQQTSLESVPLLIITWIILLLLLSFHTERIFPPANKK